MSVIVLDNGAWEIKAGTVSSALTGGSCLHVINALMRSRDRRLWLGNMVSECPELTELQYRRPIERGQLYNWELQKAIWDWMWNSGDVCRPEDLAESTLILTEAPTTLPQVTMNTDQIVFEEYEFARYRRCTPQSLVGNAAYGFETPSLVVDAGFTSTLAVPVLPSIGAKVGADTVRRLDVGGKVVTNYLKEIVSYRYYNMLEETAILNRIKERACFTSLNFIEDLQQWHRHPEQFRWTYALPSPGERWGNQVEDLDEARRLQKGGDRQILVLENERFSAPESVFDPLGTVGLEQGGIHEVVGQAIGACPEEIQPLLWSNVIVCGGWANSHGFKERLEKELRSLAPADVEMRLRVGGKADRSEAAWEGGVALAQDPERLQEMTVSRQDYLEHGQSYLNRIFGRMR